MTTSSITLTILNKRVGPVRGRHPWVFSGAIIKIPDGIATGTPIELTTEAGDFLASGYFNSYSQIAVRVWGFTAGEAVNEDFFRRRICTAKELRERFVASKETNAYRLVHSENDLLPGLVVDKYADYLSVQFHNRGIAAWKTEIVAALVAELKPTGIFERSDVGNRAKEGGMESGLLYGTIPDRITILENGLQFLVDIQGGQKTGFFLDQRDKRKALQKYVEGKSVLNCFSYTGGFSVSALAAGATRVVSVDASEPAIVLAEENVLLNKKSVKKAEFVVEDVKKYLTTAQPEEFDVIILDPPAFVKDRHKVREGMNGYRNINEQALRLLPSGGILVTCSCSQHVSLNDFRFMLSEAAARAGRTVQILETLTHGIDHPELVAFTEGEYLKCLIVVVQ